jgi:hypothetical protein
MANHAHAQSDEPTVAIVGPDSVEETSTDEDEPEPARFDVTVTNAPETGGFQFILAFDPDYFEYSGAERGEFLGSSGRDVQCDEPQPDVGAVRIVCVTLGEEPEGATGAGTLYTVLLLPKATGDTTLSLSRVVLSNPPGDEIPSTSTNLDVSVKSASSGIDWMIWGPVIGGAVLLILLCAAVMIALTRRGRASSAASPDYGSSNSS